MDKFKAELFNTYNKYTRKYSINVKISKQKSVLATVYIIFTLVTVSILAVFAIRPALTTIAALQRQLEQNKQLEQHMRDKLLALSTLDTAYAELTPNLPTIFLAIPKSSQIPYLTRQLEQLAQGAGLTVANLVFDTLEIYPAQKTNQPLYSFTFVLTVDGTQNGVNQFISDLIFFDRIISIDRISSGKSANSASYEATIVGRAYYYNQ